MQKNFDDLYKAYERKLEIEAELKSAKAELKKAQNLLQLDELKCRKRVLRRLQYCDESDVITPKVQLFNYLGALFLKNS